MARSSWDELEDFEVPREGAGLLAEERADERREAAEEFVELLLKLKLTGERVSAKHVCLLCHYVVSAGVGDPNVAALALGPLPSEQSGHYQRKLDDALNLGEEFEFYQLPMPGQEKHELDRTCKNMPTLLPMVTLTEEIRSNHAAASARLRDGFAEQDWADSYLQHPLYTSRGVGEEIWPIALYLDGVRFQKKDFLWCFVIYSLATGVRHLACILRASSMCRCGCGGWCNFSVVLRWIHWNLEALSKGLMPATRHDGSPWGDADSSYKPGASLIKAALVSIKADWGEIVNTLGFVGWGALLHPCYCCCATKDDLDKLGDFSALDEPFAATTQAQYDAACAACETTCYVDSELKRARLKGLLIDDVRPRGGHGRCLIADFGDTLLKGDRLEPGADLWDVRDFDVRPIPFTCLFWRTANESLCKHRCPLFSHVTSVTLNTIMIDVLHTFYLHGVYGKYIAHVFYELLIGDAWRVGGADEQAKLKAGIHRLRADLFVWYATQRGRENVYRLQDLTLGMLGPRNLPSMTTHAAETGTLLEYCVDAVHRLRAFLPHNLREAYVLAGDALLEYHVLMQQSPRVLTPPVHQEFVSALRRYFVFSRLAELPVIPKWHLALHLTLRAGRNGNPRTYSTFLDESLNGRIAAIAGAAHRITFYPRVLMQFNTCYAGLEGSRTKNRRLA